MKRFVVVAAAALALAGCGSTVPFNSADMGSSNGLSSSAADSGPSPSVVTGSVSASGLRPATQGQTVASSAGTGAASAAEGGSVATGVNGQTPTGPTVSAETTPGAAAAKAPIRIGVIYTPGINAVASAMGINGLNTGNTEAEADAMASWINANGGLAGHPIQMFGYSIDMSAGSPDQVDQESCTAMSQDLKVRYVVTIENPSAVMMPCLSKAGIGLLDDETSLDDADLATYAGYLADPGEFSAGRMNSAQIDSLWKQDWLTSSSKVGILADDSPGGHAVVTGPLTTALRSHGLTPAKIVYVNPDGGDGGSSQSASAVLQFRAAGVDRVISVLYSPLFMMEAANSQGYDPWYAVNSSYGPGALFESAAPSSQLAHSAGIGWQPFLDIGRGTMPPPVSSRENLCFEIMKKAGQDDTSGTAAGFEVQVCDVMFYLKDLSNLMPSVPSNLLSAARPLLGKNFVSAATFLVDVTHRTDGVAGYRPLAYETSCSCYQYVGPVEPAP